MAASISPLDSVSACLQSIIGAPVFSRSSFTCAAEIFIVIVPMIAFLTSLHDSTRAEARVHLHLRKPRRCGAPRYLLTYSRCDSTDSAALVSEAGPLREDLAPMTSSMEMLSSSLAVTESAASDGSPGYSWPSS